MNVNDSRNRKTFAMIELRATMTKGWGNQFVNVRLVGKVTVAVVNQHQNVVAMLNAEITLFVSMEFAHASKDSKEISQTCKRFAQRNIINAYLSSLYCQLRSWILRRSNLR